MLKCKTNTVKSNLENVIGKYKPCEFKLTSSKILFVGVIPASFCDPNHPGCDLTTKAVTSALGISLDWFDILKVTPQQPFGKIGFHNIVHYIETNHTQIEKDAFRDGIYRIVDMGNVKCVYICGKVVRKYLGMTDLKEVCLSTTPKGTKFLIVPNGNHPSWHLVSARNPMAVDAYRRDMALVSACVAANMNEIAKLSESDLLDTIQSSLNDRHRDHIAGEKRIMRLMGIKEDRWPDHLKHMRLQAWESPEIEDRFKHFLDSDLDVSILKYNGVVNGIAHSKGYLARLEYWQNVVDKGNFYKFMCESVASGLAGEDFASFEARLQYWLKVIGESNFHKFMCNGVASGLVGQDFSAFEARLQYWLGVVGKPNFHKFMCGGVASGLSGEGYASFEARLQYWLGVVGKENFHKFMCNSVASGLSGKDFSSFEARLQYWIGVVGKPNFHKFMCDGVAKKLSGPDHDKFQIAVHRLRGVMSISELVTFMTGGVASRILNNQFLLDVISYYGGSSKEERKIFLKFFPRCVSTIDTLGSEKFWERVSDICEIAPQITRDAAVKRMREIEDVAPYKRQKNP
jgi:hypothetical protein